MNSDACILAGSLDLFVSRDFIAELRPIEEGTPPVSVLLLTFLFFFGDTTHLIEWKEVTLSPRAIAYCSALGLSSESVLCLKSCPVLILGLLLLLLIRFAIF